MSSYLFRCREASSVFQHIHRKVPLRTHCPCCRQRCGRKHPQFRRDEHTPSPCHALGANRQQVLRFFRPLQASGAFCRYLSMRCVCSFPKYRLLAELPHNLSTLPKQTSHKASRPPLPAHTVRGNMRFLQRTAVAARPSFPLSI